MFTVRWFPGGEKTVVVVEGELEATVVPAFVIGVRHAASRTGSALLVDLGNVTGIDATGAESLVELRRMLERSDVRLLLANVSPALDSVISRTVERADDPRAA